ncbi:HK97-gp10 family putative phage morphogenesis protein [Neptuniibacter sp.]|uniref:HK97-gp10 family putative phage morphogenesis protein n=1 Tax=Neptuniibacter sp. TaxID=1962643 RepID=UPI00260A165C|nr:HK97-gp10 family putative phage morphogenesis protein [Neptuniibacter sp.]MCP4597792.1 hypothetical protein [Neptuniibacter sp.]
MELDFNIQGLDRLEEQLVDLGGEVGFKSLRFAARKSMAPVLDDAKANARVDTGDMKDSLSIRTRRGKSGDTVVTASVGSFKRSVKNQDGSKRKISKQHHKVMAQEYGVRNIPAQPFLRPALDKNAAVVLGIFRTELSKAIARAIKRAGK